MVAYIKMIAAILIPSVMIGIALVYGIGSVPAEIALGHVEMDILSDILERSETHVR